METFIDVDDCTPFLIVPLANDLHGRRGKEPIRGCSANQTVKLLSFLMNLSTELRLTTHPCQIERTTV